MNLYISALLNIDIVRRCSPPLPLPLRIRWHCVFRRLRLFCVLYLPPVYPCESDPFACRSTAILLESWRSFLRPVIRAIGATAIGNSTSRFANLLQRSFHALVHQFGNAASRFFAVVYSILHYLRGLVYCRCSAAVFVIFCATITRLLCCYGCLVLCTVDNAHTMYCIYIPNARALASTHSYIRFFTVMQCTSA